MSNTPITVISLDPKQTKHLKETIPLSEVLFRTRIEQLLHNTTQTPYDRINTTRNWLNAQLFPEFEFYLEDTWNETVTGETHFEYRLRSSNTFNETELMAHDIYKNHQDTKGVWHLDDYEQTLIHFTNAEPLIEFMNANGFTWQPEDET